MTASNTRKEARKSLKGQWKSGVLIILVYAIIDIILTLITRNVTGVCMKTLMLAIQIIITAPIIFGLIASFMKLRKKEKVGPFEFISLGFSNFTRSWSISIRILLKLLIPMALIIISISLIYAGMSATGTSVIITSTGTIETVQDLNNALTATVRTQNVSNIIVILLGTLLLIASLVSMYLKYLSCSMSYYIAIEEKKISASEAIVKSMEMMNGYKGKYFYLDLTFIGWAFLCILTAGIGFLWLVPYISMSKVCFYDELKAEHNKKAKKTTKTTAKTETKKVK